MYSLGCRGGDATDDLLARGGGRHRAGREYLRRGRVFDQQGLRSCTARSRRMLCFRRRRTFQMSLAFSGTELVCVGFLLVTFSSPFSSQCLKAVYVGWADAYGIGMAQE